MTFNTSLVAVWYSSDSCSSRCARAIASSRAFSIAMTACAAKFCNSAICLSVNGRTSCGRGDVAEQRIILAQRHAEDGADAAELDDGAAYRIAVR